MSVVLNKESKRAVDYRKAIIYLCIHLQGKINIDVYNILLTVCYMQEILYGAEKDRNMSRIFRYHLLRYVHTDLLIDFLGRKLNALTKRKMFEKYIHSISMHAGKQLRIVSGKSTHAEQQERHFHSIKTLSKLTSHHRPNDVIFNLWMRSQANKILNEKQNVFEKDKSLIKEINSALPPPKNILISFEHILSKPDQWQAFLETMIPDFLTECGVWWKECGVWWKECGVWWKECGVWWKENESGIECFDVKNNTGSKIMKYHYRSSSMVSEEKYLQNMWKICVNSKNTLIPAKRLKEESNRIVITITNLSTIKYFCHEFPVNSPENKLDGLSDRITTDNIMHSENICLSNKNR